MRKAENKNKLYYWLAMSGCIATGLIYGAIGVIALLSFFKVRHGGADEGSLFVLLHQFLTGRILTWIIALASCAFIIWRFIEAFADPYGYGKDAGGFVKRTGAAVSSIADALIVASALQSIINPSQTPTDGRPVQQRRFVSDLLQNDFGPALVIACGAIALITAGVLVFYVATQKFTERANLDQLSPRMVRVSHALAYAGYSGRSVIIGIVGYFLIAAGAGKDASKVVNTDKAFDFIGDHVGHLFFIITALATICYGLFMFISGWLYDTDKD